MQKKFENFSSQDIQALAQSSAGQQLIALLQEDPGAMERAMEGARQGQIQQVQAALSKFLSDPRAKQLLQSLQEDSHG